MDVVVLYSLTFTAYIDSLCFSILSGHVTDRTHPHKESLLFHLVRIERTKPHWVSEGVPDHKQRTQGA